MCDLFRKMALLTSLGWCILGYFVIYMVYYTPPSLQDIQVAFHSSAGEQT